MVEMPQDVARAIVSQRVIEFRLNGVGPRLVSCKCEGLIVCRGPVAIKASNGWNILLIGVLS